VDQSFPLPAPSKQAKCAKAGGEEHQGSGINSVGERLLARWHGDMNCIVAWPSHESPARNIAGLYDYSVVR